MRKVLFISSICEDSVKGMGVYKKNMAQVQTLRKEGLETFFGYFESSNVFVIKSDSSIKLRINLKNKSVFNKNLILFKKIQIFVLDNSINVVYSRFESYSLESVFFYRILKKYGCSVLLEIPTYPVTPQRWSGVKNELYLKRYNKFIHRFFAMVHDSLGMPFLRTVLDRIVTNSNLDEIWGTRTIQIQNGVNSDIIKVRSINNKNEKVINLIGVANVALWHGYDRIIKGIKEYISEGKNEIGVKFHIVGAGDALDNLKNLVKDLDIGKYVIFEGIKSGNQLDEAFDHSDVGIAVLGIHRCKMTQCDSLKSKEYCSRGIPFVATDCEPEFIDLEYALKVPSNDEPVDIKEIISFAKKYSFSKETTEQMREHSVKKYDWSETFSSVVSYIKGE